MADAFAVTIGGRAYKLAVPEHQHNRLKHVASRVDEAFSKLRTAMPDAERDHVLMLTVLQLADELVTQKHEWEIERESITKFHANLAERLEKLLA